MSSTTIHEVMASVSSYAAAFLASVFSTLSDIPWMGFGAAVLLIARLIQDVPKAIEVIQEWRQKRKQRRLL